MTTRQALMSIQIVTMTIFFQNQKLTTLSIQLLITSTTGTIDIDRLCHQLRILIIYIQTTTIGIFIT